jgi:SAM-dependent methyltransferase
MNNIDYVAFRERSDRSSYIANRFEKYFDDSLLDVGCDKAVLKSLLPRLQYTGVDIGGTPDIQLNLEKMDKLPFADSQFSTTVCSDVLEHLDNLHFVFGELVRVTKKHLIISLPNNWSNARQPIQRGHGSIAHYGLPSTPPKDRHKWFFGLSEAINFLQAQQETYPISIVETAINEKPRTFLSKAVRRMRYPSHSNYLNRYAHTVWVVFRKTSP